MNVPVRPCDTQGGGEVPDGVEDGDREQGLRRAGGDPEPGGSMPDGYRTNKDKIRPGLYFERFPTS